MAYNAFGNVLPAAWGQKGSFPALQYLGMTGNYFTGLALPSALLASIKMFTAHRYSSASWGTTGCINSLAEVKHYFAFKPSVPDSLICATKSMCPISVGSLPSSWGTPGAFSKLTNLSMVWNRLSGSIPNSWSNLDPLRSFWVLPGNLQLCGGWPGNNQTALCKNLGNGCIRQGSLGSTCSFSPGTNALYLPPSPANNTLQVTLPASQLPSLTRAEGGMINLIIISDNLASDDKSFCETLLLWHCSYGQRVDIIDITIIEAVHTSCIQCALQA